jgi:hypothetical protein
MNGLNISKKLNKVKLPFERRNDSAANTGSKSPISQNNSTLGSMKRNHKLICMYTFQNNIIHLYIENDSVCKFHTGLIKLNL